jgi:hypothetical protein
MAAAFGDGRLRKPFLAATVGYLLYDLLMVLRNPELGDRLIILHHAVIITAMTLGVSSGIGTFYMAAFLTNELSTLFLNANYFLASSPKHKDTALYKVNAVAGALCFFGTRIIANFYLAYHMIARTVLPLRHLAGVYSRLKVAACALLGGLAFVHCFLNVVWFRQLVVAAVRKCSRQSEAKRE